MLLSSLDGGQRITSRSGGSHLLAEVDHLGQDAHKGSEALARLRLLVGILMELIQSIFS